MALSNRDLEIVMRAPLFRAMGPKITQRMIGGRQPKPYARGERVFEQGEPANRFFCVVEGWAKLYRLREGGEEVIVAIVAAGETFAEAVMFRGGRYPVNCEAATPSRLLKIDVANLRREVMEEPQLAFDMLAAASIRLRELVDEVEQLKARSAPQRIADFLVKQANTTSGPVRITLPYEKALIASRLGIQAESFSRALGKLAQVGVAVDRDSVAIDDVANSPPSRTGARPSAAGLSFSGRRRQSVARRLGSVDRDLDVDFEGRESAGAVHRHLELLGVDLDVTRDGLEQLLAQDRHEIAGPKRGALMGEQDLQPLARDRRAATRLEEVEKAHAALRPNRRLKKVFRSSSAGTMTGGARDSPVSRLAASR